jgi:hypothetical protein
MRKYYQLVDSGLRIPDSKDLILQPFGIRNSESGIHFHRKVEMRCFISCSRNSFTTPRESEFGAASK